jgi:EAL domain-containing protein (putative c-di-GMP-specific phosphodiesterase class I)
VVQNAEAALKHAQIRGEKYVLYAQLNTAGTATHSAIEARLQNALAHSEFVLFYQPKVDLTTGAVEGVEALLRWQDPESGLVSPATFIPLLESSGMILDVGDWVIAQAARDCLEWMRLGLAPMHVAVNVSPLQLRGREFVERVLAATRGWTTDEIGIDLEITESTLVHDLAASTRKLERLRKAGLRIAIDDFGTGYSSLRHLAKLPVDTLKIDLSFIQGLTQNPDDRTIVGTIISLAKSFHMTTVAEGVETDEQLQALRAMKCDVAQGYLFCKPMPMNDLCDWLRRLRSARKESRSA